MDSGGDLYGTAADGGADNDGTVFEMVKGSDTITILASFIGTNGKSPEAALLLDSKGDLYGTTPTNTASLSSGSVFELAAGSGTITKLASFNVRNGSDPVAALIMDSGGNLYGTTDQGGTKTP